jgi:hypothetical protein
MGLTGQQRGRHSYLGGVEQGGRAYAADGAIAVLSHNAYLTKTSIGAYTIAAPARDNIEMNICSRTAFAHVVTGTGLFDDGVTGGSKNTLTFAAFAGANATLLSQGGKWNVVSLKAVTCP